MYLNLCAGAIGVSVKDPYQLVDLAADAGFGGVDLSLDGITTVEQATRLGEYCRGKGLKWGLFWLPCDYSSASREKALEATKRLEAMLPLVRAAGCERAYNHIWPGSNEREYAANFQHHVEQFKPVARLLEDNGIKFGLEFIGPKTLRDTFKNPFIHTLGEVTKLADAIGHGTGLIIDTFHWWTSGGTMEDLNKVPANRVVNVHVNDATAGRTREQQMDMERQLPGATGLIDAAGVLKMLRDKGYDGPVIVEPFEPSRGRFAKMLPAEVLREVRETMARVMAAAKAKSRK